MDNKRILNINSSREHKRNSADAIFSQLGDYLFEKVVFLNHIYTDFGLGGTTSTTNLATESRIIDSSSGVFMQAGRKSRLACQFYTKNASKLIGYILSPATLDSDALGTVTDLSSMKSYCGVKFDQGQTYVAIKEAGGSEILYPIDFGFNGGSVTFSTTYSLQLIHSGLVLDVLINGEKLGTYSANLSNSSNPVVTFYPFFSAGKSTDGTQVNIVVETLQFIQDKG